MSTAARESRIAVMMLAEVSWEDATGKLLSAPARLEDKSLSGACIRMKKQIEVGAKLKVRGRFEEFSGVVRYCRSDGWDYVIDLQRESESASTEKQAAVQVRCVPWRDSEQGSGSETPDRIRLRQAHGERCTGCIYAGS